MESEAHRSPSQCSRALELFLYFFKIGFYTFGGGWSIVAQIQQEYVQKKGWITDEDLLELGEQIVHVELVLHQALGGGLGLLVVLERLRLLDQGKHIAHAKDAVRHPRRVERLQILELLARALEVDRHAGDGQHRECRTAAGVAVGLGQDDAADADLFIKGLGHVDGFLTGHGIHNQQGLIHLNSLLDAHQLVHQLVVDLQTACGINDNDIIAVVFGVLNCLLGNLFRLFGAHLIDGNACLLAYNAQLVNCCGAVDITGYQQWFLALLL